MIPITKKRVKPNTDPVWSVYTPVVSKIPADERGYYLCETSLSNRYKRGVYANDKSPLWTKLN